MVFADTSVKLMQIYEKIDLILKMIGKGEIGRAEFYKSASEILAKHVVLRLLSEDPKKMQSTSHTFASHKATFVARFGEQSDELHYYFQQVIH